MEQKNNAPKLGGNKMRTMPVGKLLPAVVPTVAAKAAVNRLWAC